MHIKKTFHSLKNSKDAQNMASNFAYLSILQIANYLLPLLTLPYLARVIGVDKFGALAFSTAVMAFFQAFVDYGFNYTAVRDIAKCRSDNNKVSNIFSTVIFARLLLVIISFFILLVLIYFIPLFYSNRLILLLTFLYIPSYSIFPEWFFQAMEKMKYITILNLVSKIFFTICIFIIVKDKSDFIYQPILVSLGFFMSGIFSFYIIINKFKVKIRFPGCKSIVMSLKKSFDMFINILFPNLYSNITTIFLRSFGGELAVGIFDGGNKFIEFSQRITNIFSRIFYPFLARRIDKHSLYNKLYLCISILMSVFFFVFADLIINIFYSKDFIESVKIIRWMSITPMLFYLMDVYGTNYLVLKNKEIIVRNITIVCSLIGLVTSYFSVIHFGYMGAVYTLLLTRGLMGVNIFFFAHKHMKQNSTN